MTNPKAIAHVGIAVADLENAIADFSALFKFDRIERIELEKEGIAIAMLKIGSSELELLSPRRKEGPIAKFIEERGEGIHHVAVRVPDVTKAAEEAKKLGLRIIGSGPGIGARGAEAAFVHPKSLHGVLLEFYSM